jgi:hypothetical protein
VLLWKIVWVCIYIHRYVVFGSDVNDVCPSPSHD